MTWKRRHNLKQPLFTCTLNDILKQTTLIEIIKKNLCEVLPEKHNDGLLITRSSSSIGNSQNEKETEPDVICIRNATPTKTTR